jgi:hypothetical protein
MTVCYPHAATHPAPRHRPTDRPVPPGLLAAACGAAVPEQSHPTGGRGGGGLPPPAPGSDRQDRGSGPGRDLPGAGIHHRTPRRARPKATRRGPKNLRAEAATDPRAGAPVALRPDPGCAPSAQAPTRPRTGGATIPRTSRAQCARAAAPIVGARPLCRAATAPAAPGPHPIKKSPPEACEEARLFCYTIATIFPAIAVPRRTEPNGQAVSRVSVR